MSTLVLNVLNELPFSLAKDHLISKIVQKSMDQIQPVFKTVYEENTTKDEDMHCTCCGWKGKGSEAVKKCLFLDYATELELFCQSCNSYLGFIPVKNK